MPTTPSSSQPSSPISRPSSPISRPQSTTGSVRSYVAAAAQQSRPQTAMPIPIPSSSSYPSSSWQQRSLSPSPGLHRLPSSLNSAGVPSYSSFASAAGRSRTSKANATTSTSSFGPPRALTPVSASRPGRSLSPSPAIGRSLSPAPTYRPTPPSSYSSLRPPLPSAGRPLSIRPSSPGGFRPLPTSSVAPGVYRPPGLLRAQNTTVLEAHGDSFVGVFNVLSTKVSLNKYKGASARGLANPNSTLRVKDSIIEKIHQTRPSNLLLMFGNVDMHINYCWQLKAKGSSSISPLDWVDKVIGDYTTFLDTQIVPRMKRLGIENVYICGVTFPVVEDAHLDKTITKYTEKEGAGPLPPLSLSRWGWDLKTRTAMIKTYNHLLATYCQNRPNLRYVCINNQLCQPPHPLDPERVNPLYKDPQDPTNIHILWERSIQFWISEVQVLSGSTPLDQSKLDQGLARFNLEKKNRLATSAMAKSYRW